MKKLYRRGIVHPSPPITGDLLSLLPAALVTLAAALSPEDREVLAYLISASSNNSTMFISSASQTNSPGKKKSRDGCAWGDRDHQPQFSCDCFGCYMSYWVRWDSSPNRQLIHEIIDAFEEGLAQSKRGKGKKERKRRGVAELKPAESRKEEGDSSELASVAESCGSEGCAEDGKESGGGEKGSLRRFVSFIGERIWGVWA